MSTKYPQGLINGTPPYTTGNFSGVWTLEQLAQKYYFFGDGVSNSLRLRASASAYLTRTESAGNRQIWTLSYWFKLGNPAFGCMFGFGDNSTAATDVGACLQYNLSSTGSGDFRFSEAHGGVNSFLLAPTLVLRDYSSWYHLVIAVDTTQATASNRIKMYLNGVQITSFSTATYPSQNFATSANQAGQAFRIGCIDVDGSVGQYFDGYMAEINFIDGLALDPSSFGVVAPATGVWSPKRYSGNYGLNGFYLPFSNGTSTTTLGYDSSGNGNNWTPNNISLTAGSTYDWMLDSPTPYAGSSYGVGNYAVLSPITPSVTTTYAPTSGNLNVTLTAQGQAISTIAATSGKWYAELVMSSGTVDTDTGFGFQPPTTYSATFCGSASSLGYVYLSDGRKGYNGAFTTYGNTWTLNDVIGVALDLDNGKVYWSKNGTWQASGDPVAGTNAAYTGVSGTFAFVIRNGNSATNNKAFSINFGQRPFAYTPPSGYKSLCSFNLPGPTINNGASYMAATTYTGTGATQSISNAVNGVSFQPDLVWVKCRSTINNHSLFDIIRGATGQLFSNLTNAEAVGADGFTAFNSVGFGLDNSGSGGNVNVSGRTYVGWQWKAGGTAVTNTAGSITSSVSANTTSGFSVVTYTGTGANATVGHGLGVAPAMIICKSRTTVRAWPVYHTSIGNTNWIILNQTDASSVDSGMWNNTSPTSSVFSLGNSVYSNTSAANYVAYCFAAIPGYSAFGSYTGNGSSDGPFVYCGFRPRYVLIKRTDSIGSWVIDDSSRDPYNVAGNTLFPNSSAAESASNVLMDMVANGFKMRGANVNDSGGTFIYAAFAENPFKYSLAR